MARLSTATFGGPESIATFCVACALARSIGECVAFFFTMWTREVAPVGEALPLFLLATLGQCRTGWGSFWNDVFLRKCFVVHCATIIRHDAQNERTCKHAGVLARLPTHGSATGLRSVERAIGVIF